MALYFQKEDIIHESSCVHTPQKNKVVEWKTDHILETIRALLFQAKTPKTYWSEATLTVVHWIN